MYSSPKENITSNQIDGLTIKIISSLTKDPLEISINQIKNLEIHESMYNETKCILEFSDINKWVPRLPLIGGEIVTITFKLTEPKADENITNLWSYSFVVTKVLNYQKDDDSTSMLTGNDFVTLDMTEYNYYRMMNTYYRQSFSGIHNFNLDYILKNMTKSLVDAGIIKVDLTDTEFVKMIELENFCAPTNWSIYELLNYILKKTSSTSGYYFFFDRTKEKFVFKSIETLMNFEKVNIDETNLFIFSTESGYYNNIHSWIQSTINNLDNVVNSSILNTNLINLNSDNKSLSVFNYKLKNKVRFSNKLYMVANKFSEFIPSNDKVITPFGNPIDLFNNYVDYKLHNSQELNIYVKARFTNTVGARVGTIFPFDDKKANDVISGNWVITKSILKIKDNQAFQQLCLNRDAIKLSTFGSEKDTIKKVTINA